MKILIYGIGNPAREDDGLGFDFINELEKENLGVDLHYNYQLQIEDAELLSKYERVIFVDAYKDLKEEFCFKRVTPSFNNSFTSHGLKPETILSLTTNLYQKNPEVFLLGISANNFELRIGLSPKAKSGLRSSLLFLTNYLDQDRQRHCHS